MKVAILGATGGTGLCLIDEALGLGHEVVALVRNPDKIKTTDDKLTVVTVDITDSSSLVEHIRGCDAVLSAVGGKPGLMTPCDIYTSVGKAAISAMRETDVKRFICVTAWGTKDDPNLPFIWRWVLKPTIMSKVVKDMDELEQYLINECTDINYTIVKPPRLLNTPSEDIPLQVSVGQYVENHKTHAVCRQDLAKFILECVTTEEYDQKMVAVTCPNKEQQ